MSDLEQKIKVHFCTKEQGCIMKRVIHHAPRVGDELRFAGDKFYTVVRLVWVYDEPEAHFSRLNIEIAEVA